jgi:hypothetical protein
MIDQSATSQERRAEMIRLGSRQKSGALALSNG